MSIRTARRFDMLLAIGYRLVLRRVMAAQRGFQIALITVPADDFPAAIAVAAVGVDLLVAEQAGSRFGAVAVVLAHVLSIGCCAICVKPL